MSRRFYAVADTLTKAEHDALELTRPFTDHPLGWSNERRSKGEFLSALFEDTSAMPVFERRMPALAPCVPRRAAQRRFGYTATPKHAEEHTA